MSEPEPSSEQQRGHAPEGLSTRAIWISILVLLIVLIISAALMAGLVALLEAGRAVPTEEERAVIEQRERPGSPAPFDELREIRQELDAKQQQRLRSAGWINKEQNIAHVPIDHAKQHIVENGLPDFAAEMSSAGDTPPTEGGNTE